MTMTHKELKNEMCSINNTLTELMRRIDLLEQMMRIFRREIDKIAVDGFTVTDAQNRLLDSDVREVMLRLSKRAQDALFRAEVRTVRDLLSYPIRNFYRFGNIGTKTMRELENAVEYLSDRLKVLADYDT